MNQHSPTNLNLCTDPWLPVQDLHGQLRLVSLIQLFEQAEELRDLVLQPQERIAIMRLLICITQRAINGPADLEELEECRDRIVPAVIPYLRQWSHAFDLVGENGAFLQFADLEPCGEAELQDLSKLNFSCAAGNNSTLFDNEGGVPRAYFLPQVAIDLLTFQNFAPGGTIGVLRWSGKQTAPKSPDSAPGGPCVAASAIHTLILADNLLDTVHLNLVPIHRSRIAVGVPVWEMMPRSADDAPAVRNATETLLGRLVPVSRSIRLVITPADSGCLLARGADYRTYNKEGNLEFYEPTCSIRLDKDDKRKLLGAVFSRSLWRNLSALLLNNASQHIHNQPAALECECLPERFSLWTGALVVDKAKVIGSMEEYYTDVTRDQMQQACVNAMEQLLRLANQGCSLLKLAISTYHISTQFGIGDGAFDNKANVFARAEELFWGQMLAVKSSYVSLAAAWAQADSENGRVILPWLQEIQRAAREAFRQLAPRDTPRQLKAHTCAGALLPTPNKLIQWIQQT